MPVLGAAGARTAAVEHRELQLEGGHLRKTASARRPWAAAAVTAALLTACLAACTSQPPAPAQRSGTAQPTAPAQSPAQAHNGISKIRHVVIIMQENRSFDSFFGT